VGAVRCSRSGIELSSPPLSPRQFVGERPGEGSLGMRPVAGRIGSHPPRTRIRCPIDSLPRAAEGTLPSSKRIIADSGATVRQAPQGRDGPRCSGMVSGHVGRRGLLHACVDASATAEGWKRGRGPSAFLGRYLSRHPRPTPAPMACRKRTGAGPHEAPMRDLAKHGPGESPERSRGVSREGTVRGIAHRVKPEWWVAGR
jgi:hypothetical protein